MTDPLRDRAATIEREARLVMQYLDQHGPSIVPHLLDTDASPGQRLREALALPASPATERPCGRYFGSDGTLCSVHNRRFASLYDSKCSPATEDELTETEAECTHEDERGSTIMRVRDDRWACAVCGAAFRLRPATEDGA